MPWQNSTNSPTQRAPASCSLDCSMPVLLSTNSRARPLPCKWTRASLQRPGSQFQRQAGWGSLIVKTCSGLDSEQLNPLSRPTATWHVKTQLEIKRFLSGPYMLPRAPLRCSVQEDKRMDIEWILTGAAEHLQLALHRRDVQSRGTLWNGRSDCVNHSNLICICSGPQHDAQRPSNGR